MADGEQASPELKAAMQKATADLRADSQEEQKAAQVEAAKWQREIDILTGRATHPENDVEYVDLDTGKVLTEPAKNAIAMPLYFSKATQDELEALIKRREEIMRQITVLMDAVAKNPEEAPLANFQTGELKAELGALSRRLYSRLTANPLISEEWLAENTDKWRPRDLNTLIGRWERRNMEVVTRMMAFRQHELRSRVGNLPALDGENMGGVGAPK